MVLLPVLLLLDALCGTHFPLQSAVILLLLIAATLTTNLTPWQALFTRRTNPPHVPPHTSSLRLSANCKIAMQLGVAEIRWIAIKLTRVELVTKTVV